MKQSGIKSLLEKDVQHDCFQYYPICLPLDMGMAEDCHHFKVETMLTNIANGQNRISKTSKLEMR